MSTTRTDTHRPSAIVPDDYVFVACEFLPVEDLGTALFLKDQREVIAKHMAATGGTYSRHTHGGNCHVCGSVNLIYSILYYHEPSNTYIRVGEDCAEKLDLGGQREINKFRAAVRDARQAQAGKRKAQRILAEANLSALWDVAFATDRKGFAYEENTITDIVGKLVRYGSVSEKALGFAASLLGRIGNRAELAAARQAEQEAAAPCPTGRIVVTGTVLSTKLQDSIYGSVLKMLVRDESGFKVWSTVPGGENLNKGDQITFTVSVEPSRDDPKFGFGKRPTKLTNLTAKAQQAEQFVSQP
jgi:hypothetical protein